MNAFWKSTCCVIGAILINLTLGTFYSIGNLTPYMASYMRENGNPNVTTEHGTWITATFLLGQGSFIIVGSYIEQYYNSRTACIFGCTIHCLSTFLTMKAIKLNFLAVTLIYGFGSGLGCGSAYVASIIAAQKWFPARKGVFTGVIVAGFGFGGLIFTNLQTMYINPQNVEAKETGYFPSEVHERVPSMFMYMGIIFTIAQTVGCILAFPPPNSGPGPGPGSGSNGHDTTNGTNIAPHQATGTSIHADDVLPTMRSVTSAFNYKIFYIIGLMMMLVAPGVNFVNSLGKRFGQSYITDDRFLTTVVAVASVANAAGRLFWGYLADKLSFSACFNVKALLFVTLISLFPFKFILSSETYYLIWMLGLFFGFSGTFVLFPIFIEQVFGAKFHGIVYGILYIFLAVSAILTSIITQLTVGPALADQSKKSDEKLYVRLWPCLVIAIAYCLSSVIFVSLLPVKRIETAIRRRKDLELAKARGGLMNRPDLVPHDGVPMDRENSLGSIVKFVDAPAESSMAIKTMGVKNLWAR